MLGYSYLFADDSITEGPSFSETGGFAIQLVVHHKIIANAAGIYIEIETAADPAYQNTGLMRIHSKSVTLAGPSDLPAGDKAKLDIGITWQKGTTQESLAMFWRGLVQTTLLVEKEDPSQVLITVTYKLSSKIVSTVIEQYIISPYGLNVTTTVTPVSGNLDSLRLVFPTFVFDGRTNSTIVRDLLKGAESVRFGNSVQKFAGAPGAYSSGFNETQVAFRNGYLSTFWVESNGTNQLEYSLSP